METKKSGTGLAQMLRVLAALFDGLFVMTSQAGQRLEFPSDLEQWYVTEPPGEGSDPWFTANADVEHEWVVKPSDAGPRVNLLVNGPDSPSPLILLR